MYSGIMVPTFRRYHDHSKHSATLYQSTWRNVSETPAVLLNVRHIYQNRIGFDASLWNIEYEKPVTRAQMIHQTRLLQKLPQEHGEQSTTILFLSFFICVLQDTDSVRIRSCEINVLILPCTYSLWLNESSSDSVSGHSISSSYYIKPSFFKKFSQAVFLTGF